MLARRRAAGGRRVRSRGKLATTLDPPPAPSPRPPPPKVYLDLASASGRGGRLVLGLYGNLAPRTVENFRALCTGERGKGAAAERLHFKGAPWHRIIPGCGGGRRGDGRRGRRADGEVLSEQSAAWATRNLTPPARARPFSSPSSCPPPKVHGAGRRHHAGQRNGRRVDLRRDLRGGRPAAARLRAAGAAWRRTRPCAPPAPRARPRRPSIPQPQPPPRPANRTSHSRPATPGAARWRWPTRGPTPTAPSFTSPLPPSPTWTGSTWSSARWRGGDVAKIFG
jgi:hypothetical protein